MFAKELEWFESGAKREAKFVLRAKSGDLTISRSLLRD
jgi:hypothetical protein